MSTLVVGGDRIDSIIRELAEFGLDEVEHWGGRKPADARRAIPSRVRLVVMVIDQLNHSMLHNITVRASRLGLPIIYSRRSAHELRDKLGDRYGRSAPVAERPAGRRGWVRGEPYLAISH